MLCRLDDADGLLAAWHATAPRVGDALARLTDDQPADAWLRFAWVVDERSARERSALAAVRTIAGSLSRAGDATVVAGRVVCASAQAAEAFATLTRGGIGATLGYLAQPDALAPESTEDATWPASSVDQEEVRRWLGALLDGMAVVTTGDAVSLDGRAERVDVQRWAEDLIRVSN